MSAQPGRDLSLCWEQHRKLLPGVVRETADTVQHWSVQQVSLTVDWQTCPHPLTVPRVQPPAGGGVCRVTSWL